MARLLLLWTMISLAGCLCAPAAAQELASIKTAAVNDPMAVIKTLKDVYTKLHKFEPPQYEFYLINTCMYSDDDRGTNDHQFMVNLYAIAGIEIETAWGLIHAGYPEAVWREALDSLTRRQVAVNAQRLKQGRSLRDITLIRKAVLQQERELLGVLEKYRRQSSNKMPQYEIGDNGMCGGDWIGFVQIRTLPRNGTVRLIREHFFQLCALSKRDPYSAECNMWSYAGPTSAFPQGTYRYLARWGKGVEECNKVELVHSGEDAVRGRVMISTIRETKQPCAR